MTESKPKTVDDLIAALGNYETDRKVRFFAMFLGRGYSFEIKSIETNDLYSEHELIIVMEGIN